MLSDNFNHIVFSKEQTSGVLRSEENINALILDSGKPEKINGYLEDLSLENFKASYPKLGPYILLTDIIFKNNQTSQKDVSKLLQNIMPFQKGFDEFSTDIFNTLNIFCNESYYNDVVGSLILSQEGSEKGIWHRDNETDIRGFKAYTGKGPLIRSNLSLTESYPELNNYGEVDELAIADTENFYQIRQGELAIWKGDKHKTPLIHAKPSTSSDELRLSLMINPSEEAFATMCNNLQLS